VRVHLEVLLGLNPLTRESALGVIDGFSIRRLGCLLLCQLTHAVVMSLAVVDVVLDDRQCQGKRVFGFAELAFSPQ
jgi:hypothetical protein